MQIQRVSYHVKGLVALNDYALRLAHMITDKARFKVRVLSFWETHGLEATIDAFPVKRSTLFLWKKKLKEGKGRLESLNDASRAPRQRRKRLWPQEVIEEIKRLRWEHPNLGKDKLCVLVKPFCQRQNLPIPSQLLLVV